MTYLEFVRNKAIYDDFVAHFGKISFPIGIQQEELVIIDDNTNKFKNSVVAEI